MDRRDIANGRAGSNREYRAMRTNGHRMGDRADCEAAVEERMKATQHQYNGLAIHIANMYLESSDFAGYRHMMTDAYYHARKILDILDMEHEHLNEHLVEEAQ